MIRNSQDIIRRLAHDGFEHVSTKGSHHKYAHVSRGTVVIVPHPRRDIPIGTIRSIYTQAGWRPD